ncbi:XRE family transcriptional regulator [Actinomadura keratinilytica]|jgi:transcriptional regulator with XRE-family HTH domain|uniref:HTH cro/C1-type domain-containing protein n=1 Tax=Actinomadura keratinilytica TaxID=547461 RepID=A0ABP7ZCG5_9ACTN
MSIPPVGARIREERLKRGVTLRALARAVGVSASMVSQIETGKSQPSVSTLYAITQALGISLEDVFDAAPQPAPPAPTDPRRDGTAAAPRGPAGVCLGGAVPQPDGAAGAENATPPAAEAPGPGPVMRHGEREVLELESGVTWERLGHVPGTNVDFLLVTYAPGGSSSASGKLMRHGGVEHGYLIQGELTLTLGFDTHRMRPGDSVSFPSVTPHRYHNDGDIPAAGVWFVHETEAPWPPTC